MMLVIAGSESRKDVMQCPLCVDMVYRIVWLTNLPCLTP
jgi:hypothetical protein